MTPSHSLPSFSSALRQLTHLDEKTAKRQELLAALDPEFYRDVITPLRLDTKLAKVALEEIFKHVLGGVVVCPPQRLARVGHDAETDPPPTRDSDSRQRGGGAGGVRFPPSMQASGAMRGTASRAESFMGAIDVLGVRVTVLRLLRSPAKGNWPQSHYKAAVHCISFHHALSSAFVQECSLCPGHYHDTARCPTMCGECDGSLRDAAADMDDVVPAFQTAFDSEDDATFAALCQQHDQPLVREDSEPFTYPETLEMGLRAQYVGVAHGGSSAADMGDALAAAPT
ncbi:hypothetical protein CYMTET_9833 [Cymbomonas tetramitiformis]|uniref:Uncharacterized protein n=1 Tax=Cymbomonas tetramitiformis TaxID=36881 RepID=A0AAE0GQZ1_9CHLO|nr:hypothetical protein CYMTET_9833 [Cymbomonas tetramitiformis]